MKPLLYYCGSSQDEQAFRKIEEVLETTPLTREGKLQLIRALLEQVVTQP